VPKDVCASCSDTSCKTNPPVLPPLPRDTIFFHVLTVNTLAGFHVDDSEVTLNVCLGKQFSGGELYFRGIRCENHVNSETQHEVVFL
jgi:hypothetical protein